MKDDATVSPSTPLQKKLIAYGASILAAALLGLTATVLGAPTWATVGLAYLTFGQFRQSDRERGLSFDV